MEYLAFFQVGSRDSSRLPIYLKRNPPTDDGNMPITSSSSTSNAADTPKQSNLAMNVNINENPTRLCCLRLLFRKCISTNAVLLHAHSFAFLRFAPGYPETPNFTNKGGLATVVPSSMSRMIHPVWCALQRTYLVLSRLSTSRQMSMIYLYFIPTSPDGVARSVDFATTATCHTARCARICSPKAPCDNPICKRHAPHLLYLLGYVIRSTPSIGPYHTLHFDRHVLHHHRCQRDKRGNCAGNADRHPPIVH